MGKRTQIHRLVENKWESYMKKDLVYPQTSFANYLITQKWGAKFSPETVKSEMGRWLEIRDKIFQ